MLFSQGFPCLQEIGSRSRSLYNFHVDQGFNCSGCQPHFRPPRQSYSQDKAFGFLLGLPQSSQPLSFCTALLQNSSFEGGPCPLRAPLFIPLFRAETSLHPVNSVLVERKHIWLLSVKTIFRLGHEFAFRRMNMETCGIVSIYKPWGGSHPFLERRCLG